MRAFNFKIRSAREFQLFLDANVDLIGPIRRLCFIVSASNESAFLNFKEYEVRYLDDVLSEINRDSAYVLRVPAATIFPNHVFFEDFIIVASLDEEFDDNPNTIREAIFRADLEKELSK